MACTTILVGKKASYDGSTTVSYTHLMVMSDRICLLNCGKIEQMDTPIAIYTHPRTKFAAGFIGSYNVLEPLEFGRRCV